MAPMAVVQRFELWLGGIGGRPAGDEQQLIEAMRKRLNLKFAAMQPDTALDATARLEGSAAAFAYGVVPIVNYILKAVPAATVMSWTPADLAEHVFVALKVVAAKTRLLKKFEAVTESQRAWRKVEDLLERARHGHVLDAPSLGDSASPPATSWSAPSPLSPPWWAHRWSVSAALAIGSAAIYQCRSFLALGREGTAYGRGGGFRLARGQLRLPFQGPEYAAFGLLVSQRADECR